jgi:hypothetical protein
MALNEYSRLDGGACQVGEEVALLGVSVGRRTTGRGMDDELGRTVRVSQWEKRKRFGNFARWGMGSKGERLCLTGALEGKSRRGKEGYRSGRSQPARTTREPASAGVRVPQL